MLDWFYDTPIVRDTIKHFHDVESGKQEVRHPFAKFFNKVINRPQIGKVQKQKQFRASRKFKIKQM